MKLKKGDNYMDTWRCPTCKKGTIVVIWKDRRKDINIGKFNFSKYYPCTKCGHILNRQDIYKLMEKEGQIKKIIYK